MMFHCSLCGFENPTGFKFCGQCGGTLVMDDESLSRSSHEDAERRQLTVMFCDLVGSTTLSERLDPEELRDVIRLYQEAAGEVITDGGGNVAQHLGDGLLVYFGYPRALEDAPVRAVSTALGVLDAIDRLNERLGRDLQLQLNVRIGVHTGEVVAGEVGSGATRERLALGRTPNVAARLQAAATPGAVVISGDTYRLVRLFFACDELGSRTLDGLSRPLELYRVLHGTGVKSRFDGVRLSGLGPLVGREGELGLVLDEAAKAANGEGRVVIIEAPPGSGKSRLIQAVKDEASSCTWWASGCYSQDTDTPMTPVIDLLRAQIDLARSEDPVAERSRLLEWLTTHALPPDPLVAPLSRLLGIASPTKDAPPSVTPQAEKAQTREAVIEVLLTAARRQPHVVVFEDLHWADPSTLEFLEALVDRTPLCSLLVILTSRPPFVAEWSAAAHVRTVTLKPLSVKQSETLANNVASGRRLPATVMAQIVERTDGVPLFVEELTRMILESGQLELKQGEYVVAGDSTALHIPETLQDSLMARLDQLGNLKELAQFASVLGREFSQELIQEVRSEDAALDEHLADLVTAGLLERRAVSSQSRYSFRHALIREAAYGSLLKNRRREYHAHVARSLERAFPVIVATRPDVAAHHYTEAGLGDLAINYWRRAGEMAFAQSANLEAISHLTKALALLAACPEGPDRDSRELALQTLLGPALNTTRGYASSDVGRAFCRARDLCARLGDTPDLFWVTRGQWSFYLVRGDLAVAHDIATQLLRVASKQPDSTLLFEAHYTLASCNFWTGHLATSHQHFEEAFRLDPMSDHRLGLRYTGQHSGVLARSGFSWLRWLQGYPDEALQCGRMALDRARTVSHPLSVTVAEYFLLWVRQLRGEREEVTALAAEVIAHSREQGLFYEHLANLFIGWSLATSSRTTTPEGDLKRGIQMIRQCLDMNRASGARLAHTYYLSLLIDILIGIGNLEDARRVLDEAYATAESTGESFWRGELDRLAGELLTRMPPEAEQHDHPHAFQTALDLTASQGARALELRAAISSARSASTAEAREKARDRLSSVYRSFAEGGETADLQTARALLRSPA